MLETEAIAPPFELLISVSGRLGKQSKYEKFESVNVEILGGLNHNYERIKIHF